MDSTSQSTRIAARSRCDLAPFIAGESYTGPSSTRDDIRRQPNCRTQGSCFAFLIPAQLTHGRGGNLFRNPSPFLALRLRQLAQRNFVWTLSGGGKRPARKWKPPRLSTPPKRQRARVLNPGAPAYTALIVARGLVSCAASCARRAHSASSPPRPEAHSDPSAGGGDRSLREMPRQPPRCFRSPC